MPIYTRTGDTGTTALFGGKRVLKCEELVDVYGSIDELNSWVGLIASELQVLDVQTFLQTIQSDLFTLGSTLAGWKGNLEFVEERVKEMEARIDVMEKELPPLNNFILPGGCELGAHTHVARAICRRVERQAVALFKMPNAKPAWPVGRWQMPNNDQDRVIRYLNRLSDLFFMLARFINRQAGIEEVTWSGKTYLKK